MEKTWWKEAVGYQILPKTFYDSNHDGIGDLRGIIAKLDYFKALGVTLLWIGPFYPSPMDDNGYDVSDFLDVNPMFGTLADVRELIAQAHRRGLRIILDLILNHTSDEHPWFIEARAHPDSPEHAFYIWKEPRYDAAGRPQPPTNWASFFADSAWAYDEQAGQYYMKIFSRKMPDLNWANPILRQRMEAVARQWLDMGIDGFRVDAVAHLARDPEFQDSELPVNAQGLAADWSKFSNLPALFDYLREFKQTVLAGRDCLTIGEVGGGASPQMALNYADKETGAFNMVFTFDHCWCNGLEGKEIITEADRHVDVRQLKQVFARWYDGLGERAWPAIYWMNHDLPRVVSQYGDPIRYHRESASMLEAALLLMKGTPFLYNGEEIGMTNVDYSSLEDFHDVWVANYVKEARSRLSEEQILEYERRTSRVNARTPMQWSAETYAGFSTVEPAEKVIGNYREINVAAQQADPYSVLNLTRRLIQLRLSEVGKQLFVYGGFEFVEPEHPDLFMYRRFTATEEVWVVCNFRGETIPFSLPEERGECVFDNYSDPGFAGALRPYEARVWLRREDS